MARRKAKIIRKECDEAMANKMKLKPCEKDCLNCFGCIITLASGEREHIYKDDDWGVHLKYGIKE